MTAEQIAALKRERSDKRRYIRLRPSGYGSWATFTPSEAQHVMADLEDYEADEVWMTQSEFEALTEFGGW